MKRLLMMTSAAAAGLVATSLVAAAGPVFYNGGPTPNPQMLSRCAGQQEIAISDDNGPSPAASPAPVNGYRDPISR